MIIGLLSVATLALNTWATEAGATSLAQCSFKIILDSRAPQIASVPDLGAPVAVMIQPDSPLAIENVDLHRVRLQKTGGWFERSGTVAVTVRNVSDHTIDGAEILLHTGWSATSGIGSGAKLDRPLRPGERNVITWITGTGRGSLPGGSDVSITLFVAGVTTSACYFKPSQAWPL